MTRPISPPTPPLGAPDDGPRVAGRMAPGSTSRITLRPARRQDLALTYAITREAMRGYVVQTWGHWDETDQVRKHAESFTPHTHRLIVVEQLGAVAGLVATEPWPDDAQCLWLVKLYLFERYRGQGIGTNVLRGVMAEAAAAAQPLRLRVLRVNTRAQALYLAQGFRVFEETPERLFMEWRAPALAPPRL